MVSPAEKKIHYLFDDGLEKICPSTNLMMQYSDPKEGFS